MGRPRRLRAFPVACSSLRATSALIRLSTDEEGRIGAFAVLGGGGLVDVILDVAGYFK
ncbi:MAG TPA: hypothetical protein VN493_13640 [Thermoanaerobaculia bacterium]|nr:hypothetical protein [Thermoanaerobaculia bacterium]